MDDTIFYATAQSERAYRSWIFMVQGALGAAGVRCVWAGAGPQRAAYRGGAYCAASHTACSELSLRFYWQWR